MTTVLRVCLFRGAWQRNDDGYWIFQRKPSDLGYSVLIKPTETFEGLETIIRDRYNLKVETPLAMAYHPPDWMLEPDGTQRPPIAVTTKSEVEAMMSLRTWFPELKLCISSGCEDVAHYHFLSKTTFTIGGATFIINGYSDGELVARKEILEEIFNEEEMVGIYRAHLEIQKAKQDIKDKAGVSGAGSASSGADE